MHVRPKHAGLDVIGVLTAREQLVQALAELRAAYSDVVEETNEPLCLQLDFSLLNSFANSSTRS
jgi:hypothetical protein